jgi:hypothetical protein
MKNKLSLFSVLLFCLFPLNMQAEWQLTGDGVTGGQAILAGNPGNSQEFVYIGKLNNRSFKVTDGKDTYVHSCGDNDPLQQSILLRAQSGPDETGLRIRYAGHNQYFKVTLDVTRNSKTITADPVAPPQNLYIMGGPFSNNDPNWLLEDALELERDAENPFIFYYKGDIRYNPIGDEGGNLKFLAGRSWGENYHPAASGNTPLLQASQMRLGGEDNKWAIPADRSADGYYVIKINTLDLTVSIDEFTHNIDETPLAVFITGDALPCGWSNIVPPLMPKKQPGVYSWQGTVSPGQFKFLKRKGSWAMCYVATSADEQIILGNEHDIVYEFEYYNGGGNDYKFVMPDPGEYRFTLNLNTMKLRVDRPSTEMETIRHNDDGIIFSSGNGKLFLKNTSGQTCEAQVFGIDGRKVTETTFTGSAGITLPKGFYLILLNSGNNRKTTGHKVIVY